MGNSNSKGRKGFILSLSGSLVLVAISCGAIMAPQALVAQSKTEQQVSVHYRTSDVTRPRLGFLISPDEAQETGMNFEFCDGERAKVEIGALVSVDEVCDEFRPGTYAMAQVLAQIGAGGIPVYNSNYDKVGLITAAGVSNDFGFVSIVEFEDNTKKVPLEISAIVEAMGGMIPLSGEDWGVTYTANDLGKLEAVITDWDRAYDVDLLAKDFSEFGIADQS